MGDNQKRYDTRSDVWGGGGGLNSFFSYACSLCVLWRGGLPPNNANSTLELKSVDLKLKAIKPKLLDHMN